MARSKVEFSKAEVMSLPVMKEQLSLKMLLDRVKIDANKRKERSLEQKIIAVKILILNDMQYSRTCEQVSINRKTLYRWWEQYGELIENITPDYEVATMVENDLALLMQDAYDSARKTIKKLNKLVDKADTPRQIYPVVEALRSVTEVVKVGIEKDKEGDGGDRGGGFFKDLMELSIHMSKKDGN